MPAGGRLRRPKEGACPCSARVPVSCLRQIRLGRTGRVLRRGEPPARPEPSSTDCADYADESTPVGASCGGARHPLVPRRSVLYNFTGEAGTSPLQQEALGCNVCRGRLPPGSQGRRLARPWRGRPAGAGIRLPAGSAVVPRPPPAGKPSSGSQAGTILLRPAYGGHGHPGRLHLTPGTESGRYARRGRGCYNPATLFACGGRDAAFGERELPEDGEV